MEVLHTVRPVVRGFTFFFLFISQPLVDSFLLILASHDRSCPFFLPFSLATHAGLSEMSWKKFCRQVFALQFPFSCPFPFPYASNELTFFSV